VPINFNTTPYVFDDDDEASFTAANVASGSIDVGATGVLFNASANGNTLDNMKAAWGDGVNFIPVTAWTDLTNAGDTIAIWSSLARYQGETQSMTSPRRTTANSAAVVAYDNSTMLGWPANNNAGSIFMANLTSNPATPASWLRSNNNNSATPQQITAEVVDHPGGDVGSPGFVPGVVTVLPGDNNHDGVVDAADYVWWRENDGNTSGYNTWRENFGRTLASGGGLGGTRVPEPASGALVTIAYSLAAVGSRRTYKRHQ
jgi:hypothetical protein